MSLFFLLIGALELTAADCPSAEAIAANWALLGVEAPAGSATVAVEDEWLHLTLRGADGSLRADRRLRSPAACEDRAAVAAVVLAAWSPPPTPVVEPRAAQVPQLGDAEFPPGTTPVLVRPAPPHRRSFIEASVSFVAAIDPAGFAPGGVGELALAPRQGSWWGVLSLTGTGTRTLEASGARAQYNRSYASLGVRHRFRDNSWRIDLEADASLALVWRRGGEFTDFSQGYSFDFGLGGGLRVGRQIGAWMPFLAARVVGWVTRQSLMTMGYPWKIDLPRVDGLLSTGLAWNR